MDRGTVLDNNYVLVHSLLSDESGKLWILNSQATHRSIIEMKDNQLIAHDQKTLNATVQSFGDDGSDEGQAGQALVRE